MRTFRFIALCIMIAAAATSAQAMSDSKAYTFPYYGDFYNTEGRKEVDCNSLKGPRTMVALVFGQSNSANHGQTPYTPKREVYNFFAGKCYAAQDPLLGADGERGSVWSRLGDKLVEAGLYDKVILISIGVGGTEVARWTKGGDLNRRIPDTIRHLKKAGLTITHMFWHQGESDRTLKTKKDDYKRMFTVMLDGIRKLGVDAPIYVAVATRCGASGISYEIQQAQRELVNTDKNIYPGADTDTLDTIDMRFDSCHFSAKGLDTHADLWLNAIKYSGK